MQASARVRIGPRPIIFLLALWLSLAGQILGQDAETVSYDLLARGGRLVASLDLSSFLTTSTMTRLGQGINFALDCRLALQTPRRLFGSRTVSQTEFAWRIGYRPVTEDYTIAGSSTGWKQTQVLLTATDLESYLRDSLTVVLAPIDSLERSRQYTLKLQVTAIFLTDFSLGPRTETADSSKSPLEYLFRQFLSLTGYGRREYVFESRPFLLSEISTEP